MTAWYIRSVTVTGTVEVWKHYDWAERKCLLVLRNGGPECCSLLQPKPGWYTVRLVGAASEPEVLAAEPATVEKGVSRAL